MADINIIGSAGSSISQEDLSATASSVLKGKTFLGASSDEVDSGTIPTYTGTNTFYPSTGNLSINAGVYLSGNVTIKNLTTSGISAANIRDTRSVAVKSNGTTIVSTTGNYTHVSSNAITANKIVSGYAGFVNGGTAPIKGTIPVKAAATYTAGTGNLTIASGYYLSGALTVAGSSTLVPSNILSGKSIFGKSGTMSNKYSNFTGYWSPTNTTGGTITSNSPFYNANTLCLNMNMRYGWPEETITGTGGLIIASLGKDTSRSINVTPMTGSHMLYAPTRDAVIYFTLHYNNYIESVEMDFPYVTIEVLPYKGFNFTFETSGTVLFNNAYVGLISASQLINGCANVSSYNYGFFYNLISGKATCKTLVSNTSYSLVTSGSSYRRYNVTWQPTNFPTSGKYFFVMASKGTSVTSTGNASIYSLKPIKR